VPKKDSSRELLPPFLLLVYESDRPFPLLCSVKPRPEILFKSLFGRVGAIKYYLVASFGRTQGSLLTRQLPHSSSGPAYKGPFYAYHFPSLLTTDRFFRLCLPSSLRSLFFFVQFCLPDVLVILLISILVLFRVSLCLSFFTRSCYFSSIIGLPPLFLFVP